MCYRVVRAGPNERAPVDDALRDRGVALETVTTIDACLDVLERVDCVVAVDALTDGTCLDLCSRVRRANPTVPIVVYPADGSEALAGEVIAAGADGYVPQEQGVETLLDRVVTVLEHPSSTAGIETAAVAQEVANELVGSGSATPDVLNPDEQELAERLGLHVVDSLHDLDFATELKAERDRFATLFENVPDAVISIQHRGDEPIVEAVNPAFERLFGYEEAEIVGHSLDDYIVPADRRVEARRLSRRVRHGEPVEAEVTRRTADGLREFMVRTVPIDDESSDPRLFSLYTDITEQKQRQKRVEILNRVLRHDLRNGMNIIGGCATLLAESIDDEICDQYVAMIQHRIDELVALAEKTRAVERTIERSTAPTLAVDLGDVIGRVRERFDRTGTDATIDIAVPAGTVVAGNELLETALSHVIENAIEHNDTGEPYVRVEVADTEDDLLALSICDNGPGIPLEERQLLQDDREITQLRHTSGLGLWLVNWVVTQLGGRLSFAENDPRGAVVTLELPKASDASRVLTEGTAADD